MAGSVRGWDFLKNQHYIRPTACGLFSELFGNRYLPVSHSLGQEAEKSWVGGWHGGRWNLVVIDKTSCFWLPSDSGKHRLRLFLNVTIKCFLHPRE